MFVLRYRFRCQFQSLHDSNSLANFFVDRKLGYNKLSSLVGTEEAWLSCRRVMCLSLLQIIRRGGAGVSWTGVIRGNHLCPALFAQAGHGHDTPFWEDDSLKQKYLYFDDFLSLVAPNAIISLKRKGSHFDYVWCSHSSVTIVTW